MQGIISGNYYFDPTGGGTPGGFRTLDNATVNDQCRGASIYGAIENHVIGDIDTHEGYYTKYCVTASYNNSLYFIDIANDTKISGAFGSGIKWRKATELTTGDTVALTTAGAGTNTYAGTIVAVNSHDNQFVTFVNLKMTSGYENNLVAGRITTKFFVVSGSSSL